MKQASVFLVADSSAAIMGFLLGETVLHLELRFEFRKTDT